MTLCPLERRKAEEKAKQDLIHCGVQPPFEKAAYVALRASNNNTSDDTYLAIKSGQIWSDGTVTLHVSRRSTFSASS